MTVETIIMPIVAAALYVTTIIVGGKVYDKLEEDVEGEKENDS